jgi:tetratricopeptide (TPR) repeat protein
MKTQALAASLLALALAVSPVLAAGGGSPPSSPGGTPSDEDLSRPTYRNAVKLVKAKRYEDAIAMLEILVKDDPYNPDILNYLGFCNRKLNRLAMSEAYYKAALKADANHLGALEYEGELFLMQNRLADAEANLAKLGTLCNAECDEFEDLQDAIEDYKKQNGAG